MLFFGLDESQPKRVNTFFKLNGALKMPSMKVILKTAAIALVAVGVAQRVEPVRKIVYGN